MRRFKEFSLNINGELRWFHRPVVMGIINITDNSFYAKSRVLTPADVADKALQMIEQGAEMIDIGGCSTAPGHAAVSAQDEINRVVMGVKAVRGVSTKVILSVDTQLTNVARAAIEAGADIINDVTGGNDDPMMFETLAQLRVPYILMHSRGDSLTMQSLTQYPDGVVVEVVAELSAKLRQLRALGVADVIIDPGFGFAKTLEQNYELLAHIGYIADMLDAPMLVGVSRKSMIYKALDIAADDALEGTTAVNTLALTMGAQIIRTHDVKAAVEAAKIYQLTAERI